MKKIILSLLLFSIFFVSSEKTLKKNNRVKNFRIVFDAGHGGQDPGAVGKFSKEKDIVLEIALLAGQIIQKHCPNTEVIFTRTTDVFVELHRRAQIANEKKADLFVSIHCNASKKKDPCGSEVYVMGLSKSNANLEIAKKENASILLEENYEEKYDGIDPQSTEAYIIFSAFQHAFLELSLNYAAKAMDSFDEHVGLENRGVKQAPFLVLWRTTMPSVLMEVGFISNPEEEKFLNSKSGKQKIAYAIYHSFVKYRNYLENSNLPIYSYKDVFGTLPEPKPQKIKVENKVEEPQAKSDIIEFKVQLFVETELIPLDSERFQGLENVNYYQEGGYYKYVVGSKKTYLEALELQKAVREKGFTDAFIVAFKNGNKISLKEARELADE